MTKGRTTIGECLSAEELAALSANPPQDLLDHLDSCRRCRAIVRLLDEQSGTSSVLGRQLRHVAFIPMRSAPDTWTVGESLIVASPDAPGEQLVAFLIRFEAAPKTLEVAPISTEVGNASEWDLLLDPDQSPLGYPVMIEVWNHGTVLVDQVVERLGTIEATSLSYLYALLETLNSGGDAADATPQSRRGVPIFSENDPRAFFQDDEANRMRAIWLPAARFFSEGQMPDLASLFNEWFDSEDLSEEAYAEQIGFPVDDVHRVREGTFSADALPASRLAEMFAPTSVPVDAASQALASYLSRLRPIDFTRARPPARHLGIIESEPELIVAGPGRGARTPTRRTDSFADDYVQRFKTALTRMRDTRRS